MTENWKELAGNMTAAIGKLRQAAPDVMQAFRTLNQAADKPGALDGKTKEMIALALAAAAHCDACIAFHARAARKTGASREEVAEALGMAVLMGGGPAMMYAAKALDAYDAFAE